LLLSLAIEFGYPFRGEVNVRSRIGVQLRRGSLHLKLKLALEGTALLEHGSAHSQENPA